jgi:hypothetical protein
MSDMILPQQQQLKVCKSFRIYNKKRTSATKDIIVEVNKETIFNAIYNTSSVMKAKVRRWDPITRQAVANGKKEIAVAVVDSESERVFHTFSLKEIQETSIEKLVSILPDSAGFKTVTLAIDAVDVLEEDGWDEDI